MKNWVKGMGTLAICGMLLAGCGHEHTWVEATCTTPRTCSECGETEGDVAEHTWVEATCTAPKTCSVCGTTEGEALGHTLTEANYQQAATCTVCGETVGEPLEAEFDREGVTCDGEWDVEQTVAFPCASNESLETVGKITFSDFEVFTSDETHEAVEGYEWRSCKETIIFDDDNAQNYGFTYVQPAWSDYYDDEGTDETYNSTDGTFTVNYNGVDYTECLLDYQSDDRGWENNKYTIVRNWYFRVPVGYDGIVICMYNKVKAEEIDTWYDVLNSEYSASIRLR
jgi:hypothetical protein